MTSAYTKRIKGNWRQGKSCKGDGEERMYARKEIREAIAEMDEDYKTRYRKRGRTRNDKARLEHRILWLTRCLKEWQDRGWAISMNNYFRNELREAKRRYKEKYGELSEK